MNAAYFERVDAATYRPTEHAVGAWAPDELHFAPLGGLLVQAIRAHAATEGTGGLQLSRVSFDILGRLALEDYTIAVATARPGRTIELIEAVASVAGRAVVRARAWMLAATDTTDIEGGAAQPLPAPESIEPWSASSIWPGGFVASVDFRAIDNSGKGRTTAWVRSPVELLAGEHDPVASFLGLIDVANGIAPRESPSEWVYPNVDLTVHLLREPAGEWVGLDTTVAFGPTGLGVTHTVLHDREGHVGYLSQSLTLRKV